MKNPRPLNKAKIDKHISPALGWILESIKSTYGNGSAAYYHILKGWSGSYPETTGYIVDTLYNGYCLTKNKTLKKAAIECADWLCKIQLPNGAYSGGVGGKLPPTVFDTGMILFGLARAFNEAQKTKYETALLKAVGWLEKQIGSDCFWKSHTYISEYSPSYHTMVIWAMLLANNHLKISGLDEKLKQALFNILQKTTPSLTIKDWGFQPGEPALTHTIAYTLQGILEAGLILNMDEAVKSVEGILSKVIDIRKSNKKLAGSYKGNWEGDYSFSCLTGDAQISILYYRMFELTNKKEYLMEGNSILNKLLKKQCMFPLKGWHGAVAGSSPIWGNYQRFRFPNWAAKFFLDACFMARKNNPE